MPTEAREGWKKVLDGLTKRRETWETSAGLGRADRRFGDLSSLTKLNRASKSPEASIRLLEVFGEFVEGIKVLQRPEER